LNEEGPVIPAPDTSEIPGDVISGRGCTEVVSQLDVSNRVQETPASSGEKLFTLSLNRASPPLKVVQPLSTKAMCSHEPPKLTSVQIFTDPEALLSMGMAFVPTSKGAMIATKDRIEACIVSGGFV